MGLFVTKVSVQSRKQTIDVQLVTLCSYVCNLQAWRGRREGKGERGCVRVTTI